MNPILKEVPNYCGKQKSKKLIKVNDIPLGWFKNSIILYIPKLFCINNPKSEVTLRIGWIALLKKTIGIKSTDHKSIVTKDKLIVNI